MKPLASFLVGSFMLLPSFVFAAPARCECIRYLREVRGVNVRGDAWTLKPNLPTLNMDIGDVLLMRIGGVAHGAEIIGFEGKMVLGSAIVPRYIWITDSNAVAPCTLSTRSIEWTSPQIKGIYRPLAL